MTTFPDKRLAAVMCADIRGYTAMVQEDESKALVKVAEFQEQMSDLTVRFNGRVGAFYGDGSTCIFESAIDAVRCAIELQRSYISSDVPVRLGIHMGEITENADGTFYGEGFQIASTIETKGEAGSVVISQNIYTELFNHPEIEAKSIGKFNIGESGNKMEVYAISNHGLIIPTQHSSFPPLRKVLRPALIIVLSIVIAAYIVFDLVGRLMSDVAREDVRNSSIIVLFSDYASLSDQVGIAEMTSHWISSRIEDIPGSRVVHLNDNENEGLIVANASAAQRAKFANQTGAINILEGQIFPDPSGDSLIFDARILGLTTGTTKISFGKVKCDSGDPMECVSELSNEIVGWWATRDAHFALPPNIDSYREYLAAKSAWIDNDLKAYEHLRAAIRMDSLFPDPYFLLTAYYYNQDDLFARDSLLEVIESKFTSLSPRLSSTNEYYMAHARGDLVKAHALFLEELRYDPTDLFTNTEAIINALEMVNEPREAIRLFNMIPADSLNVDECGYCRTRIHTGGQAYLLLDEPDSALALYNLIPDKTYHQYRVIARAYVVKRDTMNLNRMIEQTTMRGVSGAARLWALAAWYFRLQGDDSMSDLYARRGLAVRGPDNSAASSVEAMYVLGQYDYIDSLYMRYIEYYPGNVYVTLLGGRIFAQTNNTAGLDRLEEIMFEHEQNNPHHYGDYNYVRGVIACIQGRYDEALDFLELSRSQGRTYFGRTFESDIDLMPLFDDSRFHSLIHPLDNK